MADLTYISLGAGIQSSALLIGALVVPDPNPPLGLNDFLCMKCSVVVTGVPALMAHHEQFHGGEGVVH